MFRCKLRLLSVGLSSLLLVVPAGLVASDSSTQIAQSRQRITVEVPSRGLATPTAPPRVELSGGGEEVEHFDSTQLIASRLTSLAGRPQIILMASRLDLGAARISLPGTGTLIIVADELVVTRNAQFDLSANAGKDGGNFVLLARKLECNGGLLTIKSTGSSRSDTATSRASARPGGDGGGVILATDRVKSNRRIRLDRVRGADRVAREGVDRGRRRNRDSKRTETWQCLQLQSEGGTGSLTLARHRDRRVDPPVERMVARVTGAQGSPGALVAYESVKEGIANSDVFSWAASATTLRRLEDLAGQIVVAQARRDDRKLIELFRTYEQLAIPLPMHKDVRGDLDAKISWLNDLRASVVLPLYERELSVSPQQFLQSVYVFTDGYTLSNWIAPTHVAVKEQTIGGRAVLGVLDFDSAEPDILTMEFDLELQVDPLLQALATERLAEVGDTLDGMFTGWDLVARPIQSLGLREAEVTLAPTGRSLRVRMSLERSQANLVLWRLFSEAGIPIAFDWTLPGTDVSGTWEEIALTLARRIPTGISVSGRAVENKGMLEALIAYVEAAGGCFELFPKAQSLNVGERRELELLTCTDAEEISVPPTAVTVPIDPSEFQSSFHVLDPEQLVQDVTVTNLLPGSDEERGGTLEYVEVEIALLADDGLERARAGPYRLSAAHTNGSEVSVPFLTVASSPPQFILEGTAYYQNGGCQSLGVERFHTSTIKITHEMLPNLEGPDEEDVTTCRP